jgi:hypothetical protein
MGDHKVCPKNGNAITNFSKDPIGNSDGEIFTNILVDFPFSEKGNFY